ncbi:carbohydrate kinase family protein [Roseateles oligotrophus]|uniref:Carbohydrate kinase n=1 Tax=Roseateles oligotrophus TaxID=1769250 RepID=A0ABT2YK85_9BURK|nr:carbohydrate kinase [Roseateles oligotrophus]MCV2370470.1 carbohydrate kinase [Roseateles oligotrophus]
MDDAPLMLCAGEALTDLIHQGQEQWVARVGGSVWNVARALAALGERTAFAGAISRDRFGDELWAASEAVGLDLRLLQRIDRSPLLAIVEQGEPPRYFFVGDDSADLHFDEQALPDGWAGALRWAHFGGISLAREPLASRLVAMAERLKAQGVAISYDPNYRNLMDERYTPTLHRMAALADLIKVSDDDLRGLFPGLEPEAALGRLRALNPQALCLLTCGGQGASLFSGEQRCDARAPVVDVVDTVGAGDASAAGLLYSLSRHPDRPLQAHLHAALAAGSAACMESGATPPRPLAMGQLFNLLQEEVSS